MGKGIVKLGEGKWAVKDGNLLAAKETNGRFKNTEFTVSRGTDATYVNRDGLIANETSDDTPRIDFTDNTDGHLLLEPQSTNLLTYSEDFSDASWFKGNTTVIANQEVSPSGIQDADKITFLAVPNANIQLTSAIATTIGEDYTYSIWAKADANVNNVNFGGGIGGDVDLAITDNWQRFTVTFTATSTSTITTLVTRDSVLANIYIWGAQVEELPYATSYIPTNGSTVTRDADTCTGAGDAIDFNSEEGVLYVEIAALVDDNSAREITLSDGTADNRIELRYGAASNRIQLVARSGGVVQASLTNSTNNILNFNKVAVKWKANDFALWINGIEQGTDTSGSTPIGLNELQFNEGDGAGGEFLGKVKAIRVYKEALSDTDLENLTS